MEDNNTPVIDLFSPGNHFAEVSKRHARLHRHKIIAKEYWWVVLLSLAAAVTPACFLLTKLPPSYESTAKVWITGTLNISEGKIYIDELNNMMGTQAELIRSRTIQERALDLTRKEFPVLAVSWTNPVVLPFKLLVKESVKSSIFQLTATGAEPKSTTAFLSHVIEEYLSYKQEVRKKTLDRSLESMSKEATELSQALQGKQEKLLAFQATNSMALLQEQGNSSAAYQAEVSRQLSVLRTESNLLAMLRPEQLIEIDAKPIASGPGAVSPGEDSAKGLLVTMAGPSADYVKASQEIQLLKAKRVELSQFLKTNHPKMTELDRKIATQEKLKGIFRDESAAQLTARLESVRLQIKNLEASFLDATTRAVSASRVMGEYDRLKQDIQQDQVPFERLKALMQSMDVSKTLDPETSNVMEQASAAQPKMKTVIVLGLGALAGLVAGLGTIFLIAVLDDRFASIAELRSQLNEMVIGHIPEIPMRTTKGKLEKEMSRNDRRGFLEAFRNIRSSLLFMGNAESRPKTLLVTSSVPTEGKSTVATYLSATLAMGGARVLLIDGDLRRGVLHKSFGLPNERGLGNILADGLDPRAAIVPTTLANLWLLPSGETKKNPGELLLSSKLDEFLKEVRQEYDFVVCDSPPVLAADDSSTLAPRMDQVLFVVRGSFTSARTAREALGILHQRNVNSVMLIFNRGLTSGHEQSRYAKYKEYHKKTPILLNGSRSGNGNGTFHAVARSQTGSLVGR